MTVVSVFADWLGFAGQPQAHVFYQYLMYIMSTNSDQFI